MHSKRKNKSLTHVAVIAATACLLAACSSKPETADIQKDLAEVYACPIIELSDVKKVDGADVGGKLYDVAFTHTVSIKGGKEAAAKLSEAYKIARASAKLDEIKALTDAATQAEGFAKGLGAYVQGAYGPGLELGRSGMSSGC